jgi:hypothetical protein
MTRLARGDVEMATGILATNGAEIAGRLRDLRGVLDQWLDELDRTEPEPARLRERLSAVRARLGSDESGGGR